MNNQSIGIAIVGTGFGQKVHIPAFQNHPRTEIMAVYHRNLTQAKAIASTHNIPYAVDNINDIIALPKVQGVAISTPPFLHYDQAKQVLLAGKHLFLEKPVTLNVKEAEELHQIAQTTGAITAIDFEFRFVPAWQLLAEYLASNYVGKKRFIKIDWLVSGRADSSRPWNWYSSKEQGGGMLGAVGSHAFDYINWLFGKIKRLSGKLSTTIPFRPEPKSGELKLVDADDTCSIMLELEDGTPCQICFSSVTYNGRGHWIEVYGDRGTLILGNDNQKDYIHGFKLFASAVGKPLKEVEIPAHLNFTENYADGRIAPVIRVIDEWVKGIDSGKIIVPGLSEGIYSQLCLDLTHLSNEQGQWTTIN